MLIKLDSVDKAESLIKEVFPTINWKKEKDNEFIGYLYPAQETKLIRIYLERNGSKVSVWHLDAEKNFQAKNISLLKTELQNWIQNYIPKSKSPWYYITQEMIDFAGLSIKVPEQKPIEGDWQPPHKFIKYGIKDQEGTDLSDFVELERHVWKNNDVFHSWQVKMKDGTIIYAPVNQVWSVVNELNKIKYLGRTWKDSSQNMWSVSKD